MIEWRTFIPGDRIKTTVSNGVVTLYGTVDTWQQVAEAEEVVGNLRGVQDVLSELVVVAPKVDAAVVQGDIEEALERRADRLATRIQVAVQDGTVTLRGTVHSPAERAAVLGAARYTHGVQAVEDELHMERPEASLAHEHRAPLPG